MQEEVEPGTPQSTPEAPNPDPEPARRKLGPRRKRWTTIERDLRVQKGPLLAGVDEVGRGPIAGPVVACAVIMPADTRAIAGVDDSKRLTHAQRVRLAVKIRERAVALEVRPDHVVIDGRVMRTLPIPHTAVVHGDARCFSIACASILAKVTRDLLMTRLAVRYPQYIWDHNAGYTTRAHVAGLTLHGITPHHRKSFCRISDLLLALEQGTAVDGLEPRSLDDVGVPDEDDFDYEIVAGAELGFDDLEQELEREL